MKIALVGLTYPFRGGIAHYTTLLYRALAERHEVHFFALSRQYPEFLFPGTTQIDDSGRPFEAPHDPCIDSINPLSWWLTSRKIRRIDADFILFSWWHPFFAPSFGGIARMARWSRGVPACFLCHNVVPHDTTFVDRLLLRFAFRSCDHFIVHSAADRDRLAAFRPRTSIHVHPHPTYEAFAHGENPSTDDMRAVLKLQDRKVILFFGFVRPYKGLHVLLDAVSLLPDDAGYHLIIVGEFYDDRAQYQDALDHLVRRNALTLVDSYVPNEDVGGYFKAADIVAVPYLSATQSGIIQIAYGFAKPVVATAVGGLPEVVDDGETGFIVPPADAAAMATGIAEFFNHRDPAVFATNIARKRRMFSWESMVETITEVGLEIGARSGADRPAASRHR